MASRRDPPPGVIFLLAGRLAPLVPPAIAAAQARAGSGAATETLVTTLPSTGHDPAGGDTGHAALLLAPMAVIAALTGGMRRAGSRRHA